MNRPSAAFRRRAVRRAASWRTVLVTAVLAGTVVTLGFAGLGGLLSGTGAAAGAGAGGGAAVVLTGVSLLLVDLTQRRRPELTLLVFMIGFAGKLSVFALVLMLVPPPDGLSAGWAVAAVAVVVLVMQAAVVRGFVSMRLPIASVADP